MEKNKNLDEYLAVAKEAALLAGRHLLKRGQSSTKVNENLRHDVKIAADIESEGIILGHLKKKSRFSILSEEKGLSSGDVKEYRWIVDPLDGSLNYLRGIPISCVSIGLWQKEKPILGVVYDFNKDEVFSGIAGQVSRLNGKKLEVSSVSKKEDAVLCSGFPVNMKIDPDNITSFIKTAGSYKKIRYIGSAALSIAYVASGRADAYKEENIMLWDIAGAVPVLLGAGGKIDIKPSSKEGCYNIYGSNGRIN